MARRERGRRGLVVWKPEGVVRVVVNIHGGVAVGGVGAGLLVDGRGAQGVHVWCEAVLVGVEGLSAALYVDVLAV